MEPLDVLKKCSGEHASGSDLSGKKTVSASSC